MFQLKIYVLLLFIRLNYGQPCHITFHNLSTLYKLLKINKM